MSEQKILEMPLADLDPDHVYPTVGAAVRAYEQQFPGAEPG